MNRVKLKICGLKRSEDVLLVNRYRPDYAGFVFAGEKRRITPEQAAELRRLLLPEIQSVGVFVNADPELIIRLAETGVIDLIQLHGDEDENYIKQLRQRTKHKILRALRVQRAEDIIRAAELSADYLLFDTYRPGMYGGSGKSFDWRIIGEAQESLESRGKYLPDYFMAGGICAENVAEAIALQSYALDVSSGVEADGVKSEEKLREFTKHYYRCLENSSTVLKSSVGHILK